ncbi:MAG: hypothetical protein H0X14_00075 [Acidobacteria bacterium]|nr:hypothetical protein [Acidobacteriota bacterium]
METKNQPTMPTLGSFTFAPDVAAAVALALEGAAASMHTAGRVRLDVARIIEGSRPLRDALAGARCAMADAGRVAGCVAAFVRALRRQSEETGRLLADAIAAMPEEEREELRRAIEDAPLERVDVNAAGNM